MCEAWILLFRGCGVPLQDNVTKGYWDAHYERELTNFEDDDEGVDWFSENIGTRLIDWICDLVSGVDVIDVGCGSGAFLFRLQGCRSNQIHHCDDSLKPFVAIGDEAFVSSVADHASECCFDVVVDVANR